MNNTEKLKAESILKKMKKVALTGTALAMMAGVFATGGTQAFANESTDETPVLISSPLETAEVQEDSKEEAVITLDSFHTNNDEVRRSAIEKAFGIELDVKDVWADKYNEDQTYTSHDALKVLDSYAMNATRQELIQFGIRTNIWEPYDALSAMESPAFYEFIDGKFVKNKFYYGARIESQIRNGNAIRTKDLKTEDQEVVNSEADSSEVMEVTRTFFEELIEDFKNAPGVTPYVIGFNSNPSSAIEFGVEQPGLEFYNSKWNHSDVMMHGRFSPEGQQKQAEKALEAQKAEAEKEAQHEANTETPEQPTDADKPTA
ncbi:hypothetical protein [Sporosarcina sp. FSL K6-1508]|uniref:hypothetical protein n=1 Tax=Sporosarcina sp. FSL K6-1508 TaxID=2921553 RepID=UPI0030FAA987